jgi:histidine triad (HIT) family protein
MQDCIFCKIASNEIPKVFTYEDEDIMAFPDIRPTKPIHLLIVPKKHITEFMESDVEILGKAAIVVQKLVRENGLINQGYRIVINGGGAQEVDHLHIHLTGPWGQSVKPV